MISALAIAGVIAVIAGRQATSLPATRLGAYVGVDLHSVVVDPRDSNHIFVGGHDGAVESLDGGLTFRAVAGLLSIDAMGWSVSGDGRTMIVGGHSGLRVSLDGGATWHDQTTKLPASDVHGLGMDPVSPSHWWAFVNGRGVYQTIDEGNSWSLLGGTSLMMMGPIISLAGGDLLGSDMQRGVIRSKDGGRTWSTAANHIPMWLTTDPARPNRIWGADGGIAVSVDGGATWRTMPDSPHGASALAVSADNKMYAGVLTGNQATVYLSTDEGATWRHVVA